MAFLGFRRNTPIIDKQEPYEIIGIEEEIEHDDANEIIDIEDDVNEFFAAEYEFQARYNLHFWNLFGAFPQSSLLNTKNKEKGSSFLMANSHLELQPRNLNNLT